MRRPRGEVGDGVREQNHGQAANRGERGVLGSLHAPWAAAGSHVEKAGPRQKERGGSETNLGGCVEKCLKYMDDRGGITHADSLSRGLK